jgi:hypothetical protein
MRLQGLFRRRFIPFALLTAAAGALVAVSCSNTEEPAPAPSGIAIVSGADQYSKKGTQLPEPLVLKVTLENGKPGEGVVVNFRVTEGGGTLSRRSASANSSGLVSVTWTLGPDTGPQSVIASLASNSALNALFLATSSDYYCPEEDPTFARSFSPQGNLLLFTRQSTLNRSGGSNRVGVVQIAPQYPDSLLGNSVVAFDEGSLLNVVRDCAFAANGSFYVAWTQGSGIQEVVQIHPDGSSSHFASLDSYFGSEIALLPGGVLGGCDEFGPFTVGCRDTLTRYEDAMFLGEGADAANNDAVAVDPVSGDLYFIYLADRSLYRLPLDGYTQTGPVEKVATLEIDEAWGATGMVVDDNDGSVFILVESANTKGIVKVTSAGVKTTAVDFFARRGAGDLAGIQSDLAIDQGIRQLFTVDTLNNVIVLYQIATDALGTLAPQGDPGTVSDGSQGERVGLAVMP